MNQKKIQIILFIGLLLAYLFFSVNLYKDYGVSWDEEKVYDLGKNAYKYLTSDFSNYSALQYLNSNYNQYYNPIYPLILYSFNQNKSYEKQHIINLLFFIPTVIISFIFLFFNKKYIKYAILAPIFLLLNPRLLGNIPINSKDIPFATSFIISCAAIYFTRSRHRLIYFLILGLLFGLSQSLRLVGIVLLPIFVIFQVTLFLQAQEKLNTFNFLKNKLNTVFIQQLIISSVIIFIISVLITFVTWPYLWLDSNNILEAVSSSYRFPSVAHVMFFGKIVNTTQIPAVQYLLVWLIITTPIFIIISIIASVLINNKIKNNLYVFLVIVLAVNLLAFFILNPLIYDGMRHGLYLIPIISLLSTISIIEIFQSLDKKRLIKILFIFLIVFNIGKLSINIVQLHPYQYLYFNEFIGGLKGAEKLFETDYWGLGFKEAVLWLKSELRNDKAIKLIATCGRPESSTYYFSSNMKWTDNFNKADYYICFTHFKQQFRASPDKIIHIVSKQGIPLIYVYKLK